MRLKTILKESTEASDIIKDLDKVRTDLIKKVDVLIAKKKKLYSDVDITTPMSADEKKLDKDIQDIFSQIQQIIQQKRKIKTESVNEANSIITEDVDTMYLVVALIGQLALAGQIGLAHFADYERRLGPIDSIKKWWKDRKDDKVIKSIVAKIKSDPEMIAFFKLSQNQQKGKFRKLIATKLSDNEIQYINRIKKSDLQQNESIVNEGRGIKSIQNDLDKTVVAIESEIASYKATKGTPNEKKHIDNLKKLHPIKKKLEAELEGAVSGLYRDAELKIED